MTLLFIYLIGVITSFIVFRILIKTKDSNTLEGIGFSFVYSSLSWIGVVLLFVLYVIEHYAKQEDLLN